MFGVAAIYNIFLLWVESPKVQAGGLGGISPKDESSKHSSIVVEFSICCMWRKEPPLAMSVLNSIRTKHDFSVREEKSLNCSHEDSAEEIPSLLLAAHECAGANVVTGCGKVCRK